MNHHKAWSKCHPSQSAIVILRVVLVLVTTIMAMGCANGGFDDDTTVRPPLANPPEAQEVPITDGLDDDLRSRIIESTVHVRGIACGRTVQGSGFAIDDDLIVTTAHTVLGLNEATISRTQGPSVKARPVLFDAVRDLAILKVTEATFEPLVLGSAEDHTVGAVMGWNDHETPDPTPFRIDRPINVRIEAVASIDRIDRASWLLAAEVHNGDSGAALVNQEGAVVGIVYASTRRDEAVAYATRVEELSAALAEGLNSEVIIPDC